MEYKIKHTYYCTVTETVTVEAEDKDEAMLKWENDEWKQTNPPLMSQEIDWDSLTIEEVTE